MSFDLGTELPASGGGSAQATLGQHEARLTGLVHLGMFVDEFEGKAKSPAPYLCALFELKSGEEGGGVNEDGSPIIMHKTFPMRKGDRSALTAFLKAMMTPTEYQQYSAGVLQGSLDDLIGRAIQIEAVGSKAKEDDGSPKYTNVGGYSSLAPKFAAMVEALEGEPIGHVTLDKYTEDAMRSLPPFEIYGKLEQSLNFAGSKAQEVLLAIRKETPEFGTKRVDKDDTAKATPSAPIKAPPSDLDDSDDF